MLENAAALGRHCTCGEGYMIGGVVLEAYCLKCRSKREMSNSQATTTKNGTPAIQGVCPVCSARMFRIGKAT
ncbi:MAG: hypothetical protein F4Y96_01635 [Chloroflexi bacterium]|nr:hypothetical protein [Chloroflexota bacterium]